MRFGDKARDKVSGFEGIVTGRSTFLTGCEQYLLCPTVKEDGSFKDSLWFDVGRLEVTEQLAVNIPRPVTAAETG